jgi:hypothetical protein
MMHAVPRDSYQLQVRMEKASYAVTMKVTSMLVQMYEGFTAC